MNPSLDPVRLEVMKNGFDTIADEIALILMRTAYSSIVRDSMDYSTAICDASGRTLAQGLTTPMHLGSFYDAMQSLIPRYRDAVRPGDIFIGNDPYVAGGQHLPDIYVIKPVFFEDNLAAWSMTLAHHVDVGGIVAGSNALGSEEIIQEGLRIPFLKLYDRGERNEMLWELIGLNVRVPELMLGDLQAQIVASTAGERAMQELIARYGLETVNRYVEGLHDYAEALARAEISEIPDGVYRFTDHIDGLGEEPEPIEFRVALTIDGDQAVVDWTGTSPQVKGGINAPVPFTRAASYTALRSVMDSEVPNCHGFRRAIRVDAPAGTIVNPLPPGACGARGITGFRMIDCLFGALAQAVPERVAADGSGGSTLPTLSSYAPGEAFVFSETLMGNWGGTASHDGQEGVPHMGANQSNVPIELIEAENPIRIERYGVVPDTGGPGRFRGGLALIREYRALADGIKLSVRSDKRAFPPHGLFGGEPGTGSLNLINPGPEERMLPVLLTEPVSLRKGDLYRHVMAGGGGYGSPTERDADRVLADVIDGKVTVRHAREAYGVVIETLADGSSRVDRVATGKLRQNASGKEG